MTDTTAPRILIIDGYTKAAREQLQSGGASLAADLYVGTLSGVLPTAPSAMSFSPPTPV